MNEPVRILSNWLKDATNGVNALLPTVPRDTGDPQPANVTVFDETRDNRPARDRVPETTFPAVVVAMRNVVVLPESRVTDDGFLSCELVVQYSAKDVDAFEARRDGNYVLRAVAWSIRKFRRLDVMHAAREKAQIRLLDILPVRFEPWFSGEAEDTKQVGTLYVPVTGRDIATI